MKALYVCLIIILISIPISAQNFGKWKIYSDSKDVKASVSIDNDVWAVTGGGAFKYNLADTSYTILTKADGLTSQNITALGSDASNRLWFGSGEGFITVFDPSSSSFKKIVDIYNSSQTKKQINDLFIKGDSVIVSIDFGLSIISSSKNSLLDSYLKFGDFTSGTKVISAIKTNLFFVCTETGIAVQKENAQNLAAPESWDTYTFNTSKIAVTSATKFLKYNSDILLATSNGVYKYQNKSWNPYVLTKGKVIDIETEGSLLYILKSNRLLKYSNNDTTLVYENNSTSFSSLNLSAGTIYISTSSGLIQIKNGTAKTILPNSPWSNSFLNLSVGPDHNLWVATGKDVTGKGFYKFDGVKWTNYNTQTFTSLLTNAIYNIYASSDTAVYLGSWGQGTMIFKNNKLTTITTTSSGMSGIPEDDKFLVITDIKKDSKGNTWYANYRSATRNPLSVYTTGKKWYHFSFDSPYISTSEILDKMIIDQNDTKWFFTIQGSRGVYYFNENGTLDNKNDDTKGYISKSEGLSSDLINCLAVDHHGAIWIGTNIGVNAITDPSIPKKTLSTYVCRSVLNMNVNAIAVDPIDQKWIATNNGVFVFSSDGYQLVDYYNSKNSPLPNDNVVSLAIDQTSGMVYMGTDYGLASLSTTSIEPLESFEELFVYPNPFIISGTSSNQNVTVEGLVRGSTLKIYNISGDLITTVNTTGGKITFWDGRDANGNYVATGIYIIVAYDEDANNVKSTKVAIIRK